jgi:two-component system chemotaxis response regulator CheY
MASILIADDSDAIRLVLKDILEIGKHSVAGEASDGQEAIEKFSRLKPELLLLDLAMPKKDGLTVVKEIMKIHPNAKIILITAADNQKIINQCLTAGAKAYISKPFEFDNVLKVISETISY